MRANKSEHHKDELSAVGHKIAQWLAERGTKFTDAALESLGKKLGSVAVLALVGLLPHIYEAVVAVERFIQTLR